MTQNEEQLSALNDIRKMMERSSKFISLNGFSGVFIGLFALLGAATVFIYLGRYDTTYCEYFRSPATVIPKHTLSFFVYICLSVLVLSLLSGSLLTIRKARKRGLEIWDATTKRMLINLFIPLITGGCFVIALVSYQLNGLVIPSMLLFYGLALINSSKYTFYEIRYLGIIEILFGLASLAFIPLGLIFWSLGFGVMHIIYGIMMYYRYERKPIS